MGKNELTIDDIERIQEQLESIPPTVVGGYELRAVYLTPNEWDVLLDVMSR